VPSLIGFFHSFSASSALSGFRSNVTLITESDLQNSCNHCQITALYLQPVSSVAVQVVLAAANRIQSFSSLAIRPSLNDVAAGPARQLPPPNQYSLCLCLSSLLMVLIGRITTLRHRPVTSPIHYFINPIPRSSHSHLHCLITHQSPANQRQFHLHSLIIRRCRLSF